MDRMFGDSTSALSKGWFIENTADHPIDVMVMVQWMFGNSLPENMALQLGTLKTGDEKQVVLELMSSHTTGLCVYEHSGIVCDSCGNTVFGIRYKCCNCPDYDLCEDCEAQGDIHDRRHTLLKIHRPVPPEITTLLQKTVAINPSPQVVARDSLFAKRWVVSNTCQETCTAQLKVSLVDGEGDVFHRQTVSLRALQPQEEGIVRVEMRVPGQTDGTAFNHDYVTCDHCNTTPITGIRYKCGNCEDYDLCEDCELLDVHHPDHVFLKIGRPLAEEIRNRPESSAPLAQLLYGSSRPKNLHEEAIEDSLSLLSLEASLDEYYSEIKPSANQIMVSASHDPPANMAAVESEPCVICLTESRNTAFLPCGHRHFCQECAARYFREHIRDGCPSCRQPIGSVSRIYD